MARMRGMMALEAVMAIMIAGVLVIMGYAVLQTAMDSSERRAAEALESQARKTEIQQLSANEVCEKAFYLQPGSDKLAACLARYNGTDTSEESYDFCRKTMGFFPGTTQLWTCMDREGI